MADVKGSRREKSEATKRKVVAAAHAEFLEKGYHGATIASIASRAGVAAQTVYFVFHNKPALISAVIDYAVLGDIEGPPPPLTEWWAAAIAEPSAAESLRLFIRGSGPLFQRASAISEILRAAALADEELAATYAFHEKLRYDGYREIVEMLATKGDLRDGLSVDETTDIFFTIYGDTNYYLMTVERGWSHERWIDLLCDALPGLLLKGAHD